MTRPRSEAPWRAAAVFVAGALLAAALGSAAGRALELEPGAFAPVGASRLYISGPRIGAPQPGAGGESGAPLATSGVAPPSAVGVRPG